MNPYTYQEVWQLINRLDKRLTFYRDSDMKTHNLFLWMTMRYKVLKGANTCTLKILREYLNTIAACFSDFQRENAHRLLFEVSLEEVPLYINEYPVIADIANWRLSIGR